MQMTISAEFVVAIAAAALSLIGSVTGYVISNRSQVKKADFDTLRGIIDELRANGQAQAVKITELEAKVERQAGVIADLEDWARRLVAQVEQLGGVPERLIRRKCKE